MALVAHLPLINNYLEICGGETEVGAKAPTSGGLGKVGNCYSFAADASCYIKRTNLQFTPEMSFALWVNLSESINGFLLDCRINETGYQPLYYNTTDGIQFFSSGAKTGGYIKIGTLATGIWYHLIAIIKDDLASVYLNGIYKGQVAASGLNYTGHATIASRHNHSSGSPACKIQDVRIYNHALSLKEIHDLVKAPILHYNFEDNFGQTNIITNPNSWGDGNVYGYDGSGQSVIGSHVLQSDGSVLITDSASNTRIRYCYYPTVTRGEGYTISIKYKQISGDQTFRWQIQELPSAGSSTTLRTWWTHEKDATTGTPAATEMLLDNGWKLISYRFVVENASTTCLRLWLQDGADYATYTHSYQLKDFKLEKQRIATPDFYATTNNIVKDSSGYGYDGTNNGAIYLTSTNLGQHAVYFTNGKQWISRASLPAAADKLTVALWFKSSNTSPLTGYHIPFTIDSGVVEISIPGSTGYMRWGGYTSNNSRVCSDVCAKDANGNNVSLLNGQWHHIVLVYDGTGWLGYTNGQYIGKHAATGTISYGSKVATIGRYYNDSTSNYGNTDAYMSDVKVFNSALSADDIKALYRAKKSIDTNGNIYIKALDEVGNGNIKLTSSGVQKVKDISEIIHLDDGTVWLQVSHHNNYGGTNLFSKSDINKFETELVYTNKDCWAAFHLIKQYGPIVGSYEFMVLEQITNTDSFILRRWRQTISPFTATWDQIKAGTSNFTAVENIPSMNGGMYYDGNSTYFRVANAVSGNWFGAFGSWSKHGTGIPTHNNSSSAGIYDLYFRITPEIAKYREFDGIIMPNCLNIN